MQALKLLWIENCFPINTRSERILDTLSRSGIFRPVLCAWNRQVGCVTPHPLWETRLLNLASPPGRLLRKAGNLPRFASFVKSTIERENADVVGCSNWDMALLAGRGHSRPVIYDVADMPDGRGVYYRSGRLLERFAMRRISGVILASRFFAEGYKTYDVPQLVFENYPNFDEQAVAVHEPGWPPRIAFVGNVRFPATLRPLLKVATRIGYPVEVFGAGAAVAALQERHADSSTIKFHGPYRYPDLSSIYSRVDIVWAAYPAHDANVQRAISNKFFESIWFGVPGVYSEGTMLGELVRRLGIGFTIDAESEAAVAAWIARLSNDRTHYLHVRKRLLEYKASIGSMTWYANETHLVEFFRRISGCTY